MGRVRFDSLVFSRYVASCWIVAYHYYTPNGGGIYQWAGIDVSESEKRSAIRIFRFQHEYNKAQKARTELHRPERRRAAEARSKRSKLWLARVIHIGLRASLLAHCLGADRNLTWDVPWDWGDDSEDGDSQLCVDDDASGAQRQRLERGVSLASLDDRRRKCDKIKEKEKWRNERRQEYIAAAKVIAQWSFCCVYL